MARSVPPNDDDPASPEIQRRLKDLGFRVPATAATNLAALAAYIEPSAPAIRWDAIAVDTADPDRALNNAERFVHAARDRCPEALKLLTDEKFSKALCTVGATSQYVADVLFSAPDVALWLWADDTWKRAFGVEALAADLDLARVPTDQCHAALAVFKTRHMARICFADLVGHKRLSAVARSISDVAEAAVRAAIEMCTYRINDDRAEGEVFVSADGFVVLGMGKLGGRELNYSSDIDLIFLCKADATPMEMDFYGTLAQQVVAVLATPVGTEHLYRVDLRLRPHGKSGPLVVPVGAATNYYESRGAAGELMALLKARPIAGNLALGQRFLDRVRSLVYPLYPNIERIRALQAIKRRIEAEADRRGEARTQVKTGVGGIRDIEFMVQFLQMLNGGRVEEIVDPNTLKSLTRLYREAFLNEDETQRARRSYIFLRTVEHHLQLMYNLQTHLLPEDETELAALARGLGLGGRDTAEAAAAFRAEYRRRTTDARSILNAVFHNFIATGSDHVDAITAAVLDAEYPPDAVREILGRHGFADPQTASMHFQSLAQETARFAAGSSRRTRHYLAAIAPALLSALARSPDPDRGLLNLVRCTEGYGARSTFYQLLAETPEALSLFVDLCAGSQFLSDILVSNPSLLDPVIDALMLGLEKSPRQLCAELVEGIETTGDIGIVLRDHYDREMLRIGIRDIQEKTNVRNVMDEISDLAESIVTGSDQVICADADLPEGLETCIVALGSLGAREMVYSSDLDLMFLYTARSDIPAGDAVETCSRIAQQLISTCSGVYKVDARLRPSGRAGVLATSIPMFGRYFSQSAQLWEFMALAKARPIAGNAAIQTAVAEDIAGALRLARERFDIVDEVMTMRRRVIEAAPPADIKRAEGGLVDLEFAVQMLQLIHATKHPSILKTNAIDAILESNRLGLLSDVQVDRMLTAYEFFRFVEDRLRIVHNLGGDVVPADRAEQGALARRMGYETGAYRSAADNFLDELAYNRKMAAQILMAIAEACQ